MASESSSESSRVRASPSLILWTLNLPSKQTIFTRIYEGLSHFLQVQYMFHPFSIYFLMTYSPPTVPPTIVHTTCLVNTKIDRDRYVIKVFLHSDHETILLAMSQLLLPKPILFQFFETSFVQESCLNSWKKVVLMNLYNIYTVIHLRFFAKQRRLTTQKGKISSENMETFCR